MYGNIYKSFKYQLHKNPQYTNNNNAGIYKTRVRQPRYNLCLTVDSIEALIYLQINPPPPHNKKNIAGHLR